MIGGCSGTCTQDEARKPTGLKDPAVRCSGQASGTTFGIIAHLVTPEVVLLHGDDPWSIGYRPIALTVELQKLKWSGTHGSRPPAYRVVATTEYHINGASGADRTPDLLRVMQAFWPLNYRCMNSCRQLLVKACRRARQNLFFDVTDLTARRLVVSPILLGNGRW